MIRWKWCGRKRLWLIFRYYPTVRLKGLRNSTKALNQGRWAPISEQKPGPRKGESGLLAKPLVQHC